MDAIESMDTKAAVTVREPINTAQAADLKEVAFFRTVAQLLPRKSLSPKRGWMLLTLLVLKIG